MVFNASFNDVNDDGTKSNLIVNENLNIGPHNTAIYFCNQICLQPFILKQY